MAASATFAVAAPKCKVTTATSKPDHQAVQRKLLARARMPPLVMMKKYNYLKTTSCRSAWKLACKLRKEVLRRKGAQWFTDHNDVPRDTEVEGAAG